jgi:hypothetical protein
MVQSRPLRASHCRRRPGQEGASGGNQRGRWEAGGPIVRFHVHGVQERDTPVPCEVVATVPINRNSQAPRRIGPRRRSECFSHMSSAISRDSTGVLMPTGVEELRSRSQSSQTTSHRRSDRCTILGWWTFRNALCNRLLLLLANRLAEIDPSHNPGGIARKSERRSFVRDDRRATRPSDPHPDAAGEDFSRLPVPRIRRTPKDTPCRSR